MHANTHFIYSRHIHFFSILAFLNQKQSFFHLFYEVVNFYFFLFLLPLTYLFFFTCSVNLWILLFFLHFFSPFILQYSEFFVFFRLLCHFLLLFLLHSFYETVNFTHFFEYFRGDRKYSFFNVVHLFYELVNYIIISLSFHQSYHTWLLTKPLTVSSSPSSHSTDQNNLIRAFSKQFL